VTLAFTTEQDMIKHAAPREISPPATNLLLERLDPADYESLMKRAKVVTFKLKQRLFRQDDAVDAVYFPLSCMISLLVTSEGEPRIELATVGREGVVGAAELMQQQGAMGLNLIQIPGTAVRIPSSAFLAEISSRPGLSKVIQRHQYALLRQILYAAACNRIHSMEERCARWLLTTHDRAGQDTFPLTQEFLSTMLGVRRATVNVATGMLKKAGFIRYVRGYITVTDRDGLESSSCTCYRSINEAYESAMNMRST
jgi:CRP-like cAMP-binding protein